VLSFSALFPVPSFPAVTGLHRSSRATRKEPPTNAHVARPSPHRPASLSPTLPSPTSRPGVVLVPLQATTPTASRFASTVRARCRRRRQRKPRRKPRRRPWRRRPRRWRRRRAEAAGGFKAADGARWGLGASGCYRVRSLLGLWRRALERTLDRVSTYARRRWRFVGCSLLLCAGLMWPAMGVALLPEPCVSACVVRVARPPGEDGDTARRLPCPESEMHVCSAEQLPQH